MAKCNNSRSWALNG